MFSFRNLFIPSERIFFVEFIFDKCCCSIWCDISCGQLRTFSGSYNAGNVNGAICCSFGSYKTNRFLKNDFSIKSFFTSIKGISRTCKIIWCISCKLCWTSNGTGLQQARTPWGSLNEMRQLMEIFINKNSCQTLEEFLRFEEACD